MAADGEFNKLSLQAYSDENFSQKSGAPFEVMINPDSYSRSYSISYVDKENLGGLAKSPKFNKILSEKLSFKIVLDSTGVVPLTTSNKGKDVEKMVKDLKMVVYNYQGKIHQPNFVQLQWSPMIFNGRLESLTIDYKLFRADGTPLRANLSLSFIEFMSEKLTAATEGDNSPDMTHIVTIKQGDTLVDLCQKVYGKSKYYLQVAHYNDLTNFRHLTPGSKMMFPPLK